MWPLSRIAAVDYGRVIENPAKEPGVGTHVPLALSSEMFLPVESTFPKAFRRP